MQTLFSRGPSVTLRTIILVIVSIILMIADHRWNHTENLRGSIESYVIYPLRYIINIPTRMLDWSGQSFSSHQFLLDENQDLKEQQLRAQVSLQKLSILEKENERLRNMLSARSKVGELVLVAELLSVDMDPYKQQVIINKGRDKQVYLGQPIIDAWGVMGQIIHLAKHSATAMLISDPSHAIPVQINRNGLRSTAFGTGHSLRLELRYIPQNAEIEIGDLVVTSGLGERFPPNYPVGRVIEIERPAGETFAYVVAEPVAHLDRSREVLLVWHNPPVEEKEQESEPEPEKELKQEKSETDEVAPVKQDTSSE